MTAQHQGRPDQLSAGSWRPLDLHDLDREALTREAIVGEANQRRTADRLLDRRGLEQTPLAVGDHRAHRVPADLCDEVTRKELRRALPADPRVALARIDEVLPSRAEPTRGSMHVEHRNAAGPA